MSRDRHPAGVEADDHLVEPAEPARALGHQPRGEATVAVARGGQLDVADLGRHRLRRRAVARVRERAASAVALLIAQMLGQLGLQPALERGLDQPGNEALSAGQVELAGIDLGEDLIQRPEAAISAATSAPLFGSFLGHKVHRLPFRWTDPLHRRSDTPCVPPCCRSRHPSPPRSRHLRRAARPGPRPRLGRPGPARPARPGHRPPTCEPWRPTPRRGHRRRVDPGRGARGSGRHRGRARPLRRHAPTTRLRQRPGPGAARRRGLRPRRRPHPPAGHRGDLDRARGPRRPLRLPRLQPTTGDVPRPPRPALGRRRRHASGQPGAALRTPPPHDPPHALAGPARRRPEAGVPPTPTAGQAAAGLDPTPTPTRLARRATHSPHPPETSSTHACDIVAPWASRKTSCCGRSRSVTSASYDCGSPTCWATSSRWRWRRPSSRVPSRRASASTAPRSRASPGSTRPTCWPSPTRRPSRSCRGAARGRRRPGCSATS